MRSTSHIDKGFFLVLLAALALLAALTPVALVLDDRSDRDRAMHQDVDRMFRHEARHVVLHGKPVAVSLEPGESAAVGETEFTASDGVRLRVVVGRHQGYCVRASNEHGKHTRWQCAGGMDAPKPRG